MVGEVWKFALPTSGACNIAMPKDAQLLSVHLQRDKPMLWALVNPSAPRAVRRISVRLTGEPLVGGAEKAFIGTLALDSGDFIFVTHVFDCGEAEAI